MRRIIGTLLTLVAAAAPLLAQEQPKPKTKTATKSATAKKSSARAETQGQLKAEAKITEAEARATALTAVPGGKVSSAEIERENGKLIWSFDVKVPGKSGVEEVNVDAMTGHIVAQVHESPAVEKKEAAQEANKKNAAAKKPEVKKP